MFWMFWKLSLSLLLLWWRYLFCRPPLLPPAPPPFAMLLFPYVGPTFSQISHGRRYRSRCCYYSDSSATLSFLLLSIVPLDGDGPSILHFQLLMLLGVQDLALVVIIVAQPSRDLDFEGIFIDDDVQPIQLDLCARHLDCECDGVLPRPHSHVEELSLQSPNCSYGVCMVLVVDSSPRLRHRVGALHDVERHTAGVADQQPPYCFSLAHFFAVQSSFVKAVLADVDLFAFRWLFNSGSSNNLMLFCSRSDNRGSPS